MDPVVQPEQRAVLERTRTAAPIILNDNVNVVLVGHRAAGKSTLLRPVAAWLRRPAVDLDEEIERLTGADVQTLFSRGEPGFRQLERQVFSLLKPGLVVAVGGGFLSLHADLLKQHVAVLVPVSAQTYAARLSADVKRPRLRPELSLQEEISRVYQEREALHARVNTLPLAELLARVTVPSGPISVVTLPPVSRLEDAVAWAVRARDAGAEMLELRTDLHSLDGWKPQPLARVMPLLLAERNGVSIQHSWEDAARLVDRPVDSAGRAEIRSHHATAPMEPAAVLALWEAQPLSAETLIKHVEPLGALERAHRIQTTQRLLRERFGHRVTVLATGRIAVPFRCILSSENALDYLALDSKWHSALGQRFLADKRRSASKKGMSITRLGILGTGIVHSRSPRIHPQPFDRLDLPEETPVAELLDALHAHYRGFAVTSPFKKSAASAIRSPLPAINTLIRTATGWTGANTDGEGALAILPSLPGDGVITVLGHGGATAALELVSPRPLRILRRSQIDAPITGQVIWTWPAHVVPPPSLRFTDAQVAVIAYGPPAARIAQQVRALGGEPLMLGPRWFIAQARAQQRLWRDAV